MGSEDAKKDDTTADEAGSAPAPAEAPAPPKLGFAEAFALAFSKAMAEEHEEYEKMEPRFAPGEGVVEVVEPDGEGHFGDLDDPKE